MSSADITGNVGGVAGADAICQASADAAGLGGTFLAWIADAADTAPSARFNRAAVPYVRVDGTTLASNWDDLVDGSDLQASMHFDENGNAIGLGANPLASSVNRFGNFRGNNGTCDAWTSDSNQFDGSGSGISNNLRVNALFACERQAGRLLCVEQ